MASRTSRSPLHAGIQAGHAKAAIGILSGNLHLPDSLWWRSRGDFIDRCVVRRKGRGRAFVVLYVPILEHFGVAPKEGIVRSGRIEHHGRGLGCFIELQKRNRAIARRLSRHAAGSSRNDSDAPVVSIVEENERELAARVCGDKRGSVLGVEPVGGVGVRRSVRIQ